MNILANQTAIVGVHTIDAYHKKQAAQQQAVGISEKPTNSVTDDRVKVMLCGTHYAQYNGYSRVVYELFKRLQHKKDIKLTLFGFQNSTSTTTHRVPLSDDVTVVDALALENPKRNGFGEVEVAQYLKENPQDVVIIYNDMSVTNALATNIAKILGPVEKKKLKLVSYIDQVYLHQKTNYIKLLNEQFDHIIAFTPYWKDIIKSQDIRKTMKVDVLPHGFNFDTYYTVPRKIARAYLGLPQDAFLILNLNRNQPRKRWDICLIAYVEVMRMHYELQKKSPSKKLRPIKLVIGTSPGSCWDFYEIIFREMKKKGIPETLLDSYFVFIDRPQSMQDSEINLLYNACDIGINTCDGEGFGLCNFEQAALGNPQVVPFLGGFRDFFNEKNSIMVTPKYNLYVDQVRDGIGGETEVSDPIDFAQAIWKYFNNPQLVTKHGAQARKDIVPHYKWDDIANHLYRVCFSIVGKKPPVVEKTKSETE